MGGWTALWSLTISYCTHRHASGKLQLDTRTAVIVNSLALAFPIAYLGAALSFAIQASITWTQFLDGFKELDLLLKEGAAAYDPATFSILQLASGFPGLQQFYALVDSLVWDVKRVFLTFATAGVVLDAVRSPPRRKRISAHTPRSQILVTVAYLHLQSLARVISETTTVMDTLESSRSREHALLRSYKVSPFSLSVRVASSLTLPDAEPQVDFHLLHLNLRPLHRRLHLHRHRNSRVLHQLSRPPDRPPLATLRFRHPRPPHIHPTPRQVPRLARVRLAQSDLVKREDGDLGRSGRKELHRRSSSRL